jgi:hypothetical protein
MEPRVFEISEAPILGMSDQWIEKVALANPARYQLFKIWKIDCAPGLGPAGTESGDIILTLNDHLITREASLSCLIIQSAWHPIFGYCSLLCIDSAAVFCFLF